MMKAYRHFAVLCASAVLMGVPDPAEAGTKQDTFDACKAAIKQEFGESPVEFGKFNRTSNRNNAFGELTMSDGSKAQIRCQVFGGKVLKVLFRGSNQPGRMWISERPAAAIYVEPKDEKDADAEETADKPERDAADEKTAAKDADGKAAAGKDKDGDDGADAAGGDGPAKEGTAKKVDRRNKGTAEEDAGDADEDAAAKKSDGADDGPVKPRFIKVPTQ